MSEIISGNPSIPTLPTYLWNSALVLGMIGASSLTSSNPQWPQSANTGYFIDEVTASHSTVELTETNSANSEDESFAFNLATIYTNLLAGQEPLGNEFEKIWDDNIEALYES